MAVIAQRQRLLQIVGQGFETPEMPQPLLVAEAAQPHRLRPALVAEPQDRLGKLRRLDLIVESFAERQDRLLRPIRTGLRAMDHRAIGTGRAGERVMAAWSDGYRWSDDGLRLHYRDYAGRSAEQTSERQSIKRITYADLCLKKKR